MGQGQGIDLWGTTAQAHTGHPASWYEFFESVAPTFGVYNWGIDADEELRRLGGERRHDEQRQGQGGAEVLAAPARHRPAGSRPPAPGPRSRTTFAAGRAAQGLVYGENAAWIASDPEQSKVVGNVGVALPPTEPGVLEDVEAGNGYIGYYDGGAFGMPVTSKNKEAALLFLQYIGQDSVQPGWAVAAPRITNTATYDDPGGHRHGREARRLLHDAARPGQALRRRPAVSRSTPRSARRPRRSSTRS